MKKREGFTLIELLVVIALIGVVSTLSISYFFQYQARARDNQRKSDLAQIASALERYYSQNKFYPSTSTNPTNSGLAYQPWIDGLTTEFTYNQGNIVPRDPKNVDTSVYYYTPSPDFKRYILWAQLENTKDPEYRGNPSAKCYYPGNDVPGPGGLGAYPEICITSPIPCKPIVGSC